MGGFASQQEIQFYDCFYGFFQVSSLTDTKRFSTKSHPLNNFFLQKESKKITDQHLLNCQSKISFTYLDGNKHKYFIVRTLWVTLLLNIMNLLITTLELVLWVIFRLDTILNGIIRLEPVLLVIFRLEVVPKVFLTPKTTWFSNSDKMAKNGIFSFYEAANNKRLMKNTWIC